MNTAILIPAPREPLHAFWNEQEIEVNGRDLCRALGFRTADKILARIPKQLLTKRHGLDPRGRRREQLFVREAGVYLLNFTPRLALEWHGGEAAK